MPQMQFNTGDFEESSSSFAKTHNNNNSYTTRADRMVLELEMRQSIRRRSLDKLAVDIGATPDVLADSKLLSTSAVNSPFDNSVIRSGKLSKRLAVAIAEEKFLDNTVIYPTTTSSTAAGVDSNGNNNSSDSTPRIGMVSTGVTASAMTPSSPVSSPIATEAIERWFRNSRGDLLPLSSTTAMSPNRIRLIRKERSAL